MSDLEGRTALAADEPVIAPGTRYGFFTDTSVCIGCKACEVACKEWNDVPDHGVGFTATSYDNTGALGANAWRHVAFVEQSVDTKVGIEWFHQPPRHAGESAIDPTVAPPAEAAPGGIRLLMSSDVCKHCTSAACVEVCPTGALFYTEFETVVVQDDICNGCGYCVTACPFGVIERREDDGGAHKCTLCYDRLRSGLQPACAQACPTDSIQFGPLDILRQRAERRLDELRPREPAATVYGTTEQGVGGTGALFLLLDRPERYGLPPAPMTPTRNLAQMWRWAGLAAGALVAVVGWATGLPARPPRRPA